MHLPLDYVAYSLSTNICRSPNRRLKRIYAQSGMHPLYSRYAMPVYTRDQLHLPCTPSPLRLCTYSDGRTVYAELPELQALSDSDNSSDEEDDFSDESVFEESDEEDEDSDRDDAGDSDDEEHEDEDADSDSDSDSDSDYVIEVTDDRVARKPLFKAQPVFPSFERSVIYVEWYNVNFAGREDDAGPKDEQYYAQYSYRQRCQFITRDGGADYAKYLARQRRHFIKEAWLCEEWRRLGVFQSKLDHSRARCKPEPSMRIWAVCLAQAKRQEAHAMAA
ncbi:hypothetical protein HDZ31DRAFT_66969 [Schizophyllum fasciatum]